MDENGLTGFTSALCLMAVLVLMSGAAKAQRLEQLNGLDSAPRLVLAPSANPAHSLKSELQEDLRGLEAFGDVQRVDGLSRSLKRPGRWVLYGRLGLLNFQSQLGQERAAGPVFTFKRTGPKLTGKIYFGIHHQW